MRAPRRRSAMATAALSTSTALAALLAACDDGNGRGADQATGCRRIAAATSGPGDVANHFPTSLGNLWLYDVTETPSGAPPGGAVTYRSRIEVTGTRAEAGTTGSVFTISRADAAEAPFDIVFAERPSGVTQLSDSSVDPPLRELYPHELIPFPLEAGRTTFEQVDCAALDVGVDLDGDGGADRTSIRSTVTVVGPESVTVPAGAFPAAVRVETRSVVTLAASGGDRGTADVLEVDWYAPGVGLVRSRSTVGIQGSTDTTEAVLVGYAADGQRGGTLAVTQVPAP